MSAIILMLAVLFLMVIALVMVFTHYRPSMQESHWYGISLDLVLADLPTGLEAWAARHARELHAKRDAERRALIMEEWDAANVEMSVKEETKAASKGLSELMVQTTSLVPISTPPVFDLEPCPETLTERLLRLERELFGEAPVARGINNQRLAAA